MVISSGREMGHSLHKASLNLWQQYDRALVRAVELGADRRRLRIYLNGIRSVLDRVALLRAMLAYLRSPSNVGVIWREQVEECIATCFEAPSEEEVEA